MSIYITPSKNDFPMIHSLPLSKNQSCQSVQVCIVCSALLPSSLTGPSKDRHFDLRSQFVCVLELQHCSSLALQMYPPLSCSREISIPHLLHFSSSGVPASRWVYADHCDPSHIFLLALPVPLTAVVSLTLITS